MLVEQEQIPRVAEQTVRLNFFFSFSLLFFSWWEMGKGPGRNRFHFHDNIKSNISILPTSHMPKSSPRRAPIYLFHPLLLNSSPPLSPPPLPLPFPLPHSNSPPMVGHYKKPPQHGVKVGEKMEKEMNKTECGKRKGRTIEGREKRGSGGWGGRGWNGLGWNGLEWIGMNFAHGKHTAVGGILWEFISPGAFGQNAEGIRLAWCCFGVGRWAQCWQRFAN